MYEDRKQASLGNTGQGPCIRCTPKQVYMRLQERCLQPSLFLGTIHLYVAHIQQPACKEEEKMDMGGCQNYGPLLGSLL